MQTTASAADHLGVARSKVPDLRQLDLWRCNREQGGYFLLAPELVSAVSHIEAPTSFAGVGNDRASVLGKGHDAGEYRPREVGLPRRRGKTIPPSLESAPHTTVGEGSQRQVAEGVFD